MQKAGERVAEAGQSVGDASSSSSDASGQGQDEPDPLIPESDSAASSDVAGATDAAATTASPQDSNSGEASSDSQTVPSAGEDVSDTESAASSSESGDGTEGSESTATAGSEEGAQGDQEAQGGAGTTSGTTSEEVAAAQAALERAGIALQEAGQAVTNAGDQAGMAEAKEALSDARIAVIIAGEDLREARKAEGADGDGSYQEAEAALNEANQAIVTASRTVLSGETEYPQRAGSKSDGKGQLDEELDESLAIFEGKIQDARQDVIDSEPPPSEVKDAAGETVAIGEGSGGEETAQRTGSLEEGDQSAESEGEQQQSGRMPGPGEVQTASGPRQPPEDIPDGQDDDIVAQQLREAAMAETDPELREKLWEEYRRYKENISK